MQSVKAVTKVWSENFESKLLQNYCEAIEDKSIEMTSKKRKAWKEVNEEMQNVRIF